MPLLSRLALPAILLCLPILGTAAANPLVTGFAVDLAGGDGDDAVALTNIGVAPIDLENVTLGDGEGVIGWPAGAVLPGGQTTLVAVNGTSWTDSGGGTPDHALWGHAHAGLVEHDPQFRLARDGDEIIVSVDGQPVDVVVYGDGSHTRWAEDAVDLAGSPNLRWYFRAQHEGQWQDTDSAADWTTPVVRYVGFEYRGTRTFSVSEAGLCYAAPDASRWAVLNTLEHAQSSIRINVYQFLDAEVAQVLADRAASGLDVRVLVESVPVGMGTEERRHRDYLLEQIQSAGAQVWMQTDDRIRFNHAKYILVDERRLLVQTENLVGSGIPRDVREGNRGYGAVFDQPELAAYFARVFDHDTRDGAAVRFTTDPRFEPLPPVPPVPGGTDSRHPPQVLQAPAFVTPVLSPDHPLTDEDPLLDAIGRATRSIRVAQLNMDPEWTDSTGRQWPPTYLEALEDAARRGVDVKVLLDDTFSDPQALDNPDTAARLEALGLANLKVRLWGGSNPGVLHAKTVIVDDQTTLVGSMNWNLNSATRNREAGLLIDSPAYAACYATVFDADWARNDPLSIGGAGAGATVLVALVVLAARRRAGGRRPW